MDWIDTICLWVGRILLLFGGGALVMLLVTLLCDYIYRRGNNSYIFITWLMQRNKKPIELEEEE